MSEVWRAPARSAAVEAIYATAEAERREHPERYRLDEESVIARATRRDDATKFAEGWRDGLRQYLGSAREDGRLNAVGERMVVETAAAKLVAGARLASYIAEHPESMTRPMLPPIVIVGGWRTGTTFLFRLLASDPRLRAPLPVELTEPWRIAELNDAEREARIEASGRAHDFLHLLNPHLRGVHDSGPRLPEECVLALGSDLRNWGFTSTVRLNAYARWLGLQDLASSYERYHQVLRILDRHDGRRFLLKAPAHVAELGHLVSAFPGAVIVHLHRDIVETIASGASLFAVFRSTYSDEVDGRDVGRFQADQSELWLRRAVAFRTSAEATAATFIDVDYRELVTAPARAVTMVYRAAGMEPVPDIDQWIRDYHERSPKEAHGKHRYSAVEFGLDAAALRERFAFLGAIAPFRGEDVEQASS